MTDLGTLVGPTGLLSVAHGINNSGTIVGFSYFSPGVNHAFVYDNGVMSDLNNLTVNLPGNWTLEQATGINASGEIVGWGYYDNTFNEEAFLLTPTPEPGSLALLAMGGLGLMLRRRRF